MSDNAADKQGQPAPGRLASLAEAIGATKIRGSETRGAEIRGSEARGPAPVDTWHPPYCGEIDLRIAADGTWFYAGTPINRPAMVALFAGILRKDPERYVLVTPVECVGIAVDDVPFVAVAMEHDEGGALRFVTNLGDEVAAGQEHPLRFETEPGGGVKPYVHVRGGLWARLTRALALDLLDGAEERYEGGVATAGIASGGSFFAIGPAG